MTDAEASTRIKSASSKDSASMPSLDSAFKSLGFDPTCLGQERDGKAVKLPPKSKAKAKERPKTEKEQAAGGLGASAAADPSPRAHLLLIPRARTKTVGEAAADGLGATAAADPSPRAHVAASICISFVVGIVALCVEPQLCRAASWPDPGSHY